ncbi:MAG: hypothetical protein II233_08610 [Clostridia bacterium]|nr:hypothetical protein [Clostridia bacterium]
MKIEMGESLFYSWLRHVKQCQIVQTNWKVSSQWDLKNEEKLIYLMQKVDEFFCTKYSYKIFKNNTSISQLLRQAECDVLGIDMTADKSKVYAVDVAFHENGLNYGNREVTVMKVMEKCVRTAFCLYGYLGNDNAEIIFASPKINPATLNDLNCCFEDLNILFSTFDLSFKFRLITNQEYDTNVLKPILLVSNDVSDTTELFMRSYQMFKMFDGEKVPKAQTSSYVPKPRVQRVEVPTDYPEDKALSELKVGQIAQRVLMPMLENGKATEQEIVFMQNLDYSKQLFGINYPLLVAVDTEFDTVRYYSKVLTIYGKKYRMCSQWFEVPANNDRPYLLSWIAKHKE